MKKTVIKISSPIENKILKKLKTGNRVLISGTIYVARDAAHRRMVDTLDTGEELPFKITGQTIYYMGPTPAKSGHVIGSAGPTTSSRMDIFTPRLLEAGLRAMIGKGDRSPAVKEAIKKHGAVYFVTTGGASALLSKSIKKVEVKAYEELGPEALLCLQVDSFPAIVANDLYGTDLFEQGRSQYQR